MADETVLQQEENSKVYLCSGCGGNMEFDISSQKLKCPFCGQEMEIRDEKREVREYDFSDVKNRESSGEWDSEVRVVRCDGCGGETVVERNQTALFCSYCGSSHVLESKQSAGIKPEGIIPFKVDKNKAKELFDKWIRRRWLAPGKLKQMYQSEKLLSVYVPYWTYDADTYNEFTAEGGEHYYVTVERNGKQEREQRTRWYHVSGRFNRFFDDVQVNASKNYEDSLMRKIEPYDTSVCEPYKPQYISGYLAERYSKGVVECFELAKDKIQSALVDDVRDRVRKRYDEVRNIHVYTEYDNVKYKHVLLPIWTAQYDYNGKKYRYMINGQNGKVAGKSPLSPVKIAILVALGLVAVGVFLYFKGYLPFSPSQGMLPGGVIGF